MRQVNARQGWVVSQLSSVSLAALRERQVDVQISTRPGDSDYKGEIPENQNATRKELPPFFGVRCLVEERRQASKDENEVPDPTEGYHHRFKVPYLTSMQKRPKQDRAHLDKMRPEKLQTVPSNRDCEARTKCKDIVAARKNHDGNVNERLEEVKKPKLGNDHRRYC
jgi:hypothetical protein